MRGLTHVCMFVCLFSVLVPEGDGGVGEGKREGGGEGGGASMRSGPEQDGRGLCHRHGDLAGSEPELVQSRPTGWFPLLLSH